MPTAEQRQEIARLKKLGTKHRDISEAVFGKRTAASTVHYVLKEMGLVGGGQEKAVQKPSGARILLFDIETAPLKAFVWSMWQHGFGLEMLKDDWFILSWSAKWLGEDEVFYQDLRGKVEHEDDSELLGDLWQLLDEADIVVTQNGVKFDTKKCNARFLANGYQPPSPYKQVDTLRIAKKHFGFTSNKLEYMADKFNVHFKKLDHAKFGGFKLWKECLNDNLDAWKEMEEYNRHDVLALEELYIRLRPWDNTHPNLNLYTDVHSHVCSCGCKEFVKAGYHVTQVSKFQRWRCTKCGKAVRDRENLLTKDKRKSLKVNVV